MKDLSLRTSFFGVMPIVIPLLKTLGSPVLILDFFFFKLVNWALLRKQKVFEPINQKFKKMGVAFWKNHNFAKFSVFQILFQILFFFRPPIHPSCYPMVKKKIGKYNAKWKYRAHATVTFSISALISEIWAFKAKKCLYFWNKGPNKKSVLCKKVLEFVFRHF